MTPPTNPLASRLASQTILQVEADGLWWRVRVLNPSEAATFGAALAMLAPPTPATPTPVPQAEEEAGQPVNMAQVPRMMSLLQDITCQCVQEASQDGVDWWPIQLVSQMTLQDPEKNRVFVGVLTPTGLTTLATKAGHAYLEARRKVGPFPGGGGAADPAGPVPG